MSNRLRPGVCVPYLAGTVLCWVVILSLTLVVLISVVSRSLFVANGRVAFHRRAYLFSWRWDVICLPLGASISGIGLWRRRCHYLSLSGAGQGKQLRRGSGRGHFPCAVLGLLVRSHCLVTVNATVIFCEREVLLFVRCGRSHGTSIPIQCWPHIVASVGTRDP